MLYIFLPYTAAFLAAEISEFFFLFKNDIACITVVIADTEFFPDLLAVHTFLQSLVIAVVKIETADMIRPISVMLVGCSNHIEPLYDSCLIALRDVMLPLMAKLGINYCLSHQVHLAFGFLLFP